MSEVQTEQTQTETSQVEGQQEATPQEQPQQRDTSWVPRRISEITAARRAAEQRAADAEQRARQFEEELTRLRAANPDAQGQQQQQQPQSRESVEQLAQAYAQRMVREQQEGASLNSKIAAINEAGSKAYGDDFEKSVQNLQMAGVGGSDFLKVLASVEGAEKVVTFLGKTENLDEAMRIATLDPVQMAVELMKMSPKAAKALSKQVSKAPAPPAETIDGRVGDTGGEPDPSNTKAWMEWRAKNKRSRR